MFVFLFAVAYTTLFNIHVVRKAKARRLLTNCRQYQRSILRKFSVWYSRFMFRNESRRAIVCRCKNTLCYPILLCCLCGTICVTVGCFIVFEKCNTNNDRKRVLAIRLSVYVLNFGCCYEDLFLL